MKTKIIVAASTVLLSILVTACGGGGSTGSNTTQVPSLSAEGVYEGTISNGKIHNTLVLENDQFYTLYGTAISGGGIAVTGFLQGTGKSNNGSFSSSDLKDFFANGTVVSGSLNASYVAKTNLSGTATEGNTTVTFTGTSPLKNSLYVYDSAANPADINGAWSLTDLQGTPVALNITASGTLTGSSGGCSFNGTIKPRASGKNVFDVAIVFGASPCRLAGQSASGIALNYIIPNGKRQFILAGTDTLRTSGTGLLGTR